MNQWAVLKDFVTLLIAISGVSGAVWGYIKNAKTGRAEFMVELHKAFFVEEKYKEMRKILDSDEEEHVEKRRGWVEKEPEEFIEFLNFFELVAYLEHNKNLSFRDVKALFSYYLRLLRDRREICDYITTQKNSFEHLETLLANIEL